MLSLVIMVSGQDQHLHSRGRCSTIVTVSRSIPCPMCPQGGIHPTLVTINMLGVNTKPVPSCSCLTVHEIHGDSCTLAIFASGNLPSVALWGHYSDMYSWDSMEDCWDVDWIEEWWDVGGFSRPDVIRGRYRSSILGMTNTFC